MQLFENTPVFILVNQTLYNYVQYWIIIYIFFWQRTHCMHNQLNQQLEPSPNDNPSIQIHQVSSQKANKANIQNLNIDNQIKKKSRHQNIKEQYSVNEEISSQVEKQQNYPQQKKIIPLINTQIKEQYRNQVLQAFDQMDPTHSAKQKKGKSALDEQLFHKTDSFYEDDEFDQEEEKKQQINIVNNPIITHELLNFQPNLQSVVVTEQPKPEENHFKKCINQANKFLKILKLCYYINLFRFLLIALIYYNVQFMIPQSNSKPYINSNTNETYAGQEFNSTTFQGEAKVGYYQPWNIMVYFLSGSVDMISLIGYVSAIRFLKNEIKLLETKSKKQDQRQQRQKRRATMISHHQNNNQNVGQIEEDIQNQSEQNRRPRNPFGHISSQIVRAGRQSVYMSVYSLIRQYKYKNRDQAAAFKISKAMHLFATFLFFGRMALIEQFEFQTKITGKYWDNFTKESILWFFLLTAYIYTFQIDLNVLETSCGPYLKVHSFHFSKINQKYQKFQRWRRRYSFGIKLGVILGLTCLLAQIIYGIVFNLSIFSMLMISKVFVIILALFIINQNAKTVQKSKKYLTYLKYEQYTKKTNTKTQSNFKGQLQKMINFTNLTYLGILSKHSQKKDGKVFSLFRSLLFFYFLAFLRESSPSGNQIFIVSCNFVVLIAFCGAEYYKFRKAMKQKLNLLTSCKYEMVKQLNQQKTEELDKSQKNSSLQQEMNHKKCDSNFQMSNINSSINNQSSCSVCLVEYQLQENVIVLCCGHIFHESCLFDWLKQKKECPLCRLNIQQYYRQVQF